VKRKIRRTIILLLVLTVVAVLYAPVQWKKTALGSSIENSIVARIMPENQIYQEQITARKGLAGDWIINGWLINQNDFVVEEIKIRFYFGNGVEHRTISKVLNAGGAGKPFRIQIPGHEDSEYKRFEVYKAR
jgi:hypothetical protein